MIGLAFGAGAVHIAIVGVLLMLHQRWIIVDTVTLGQAALLLIAGGAGAMAGRPLSGLVAGGVAGVPIAALTAIISAVPLQWMFIALSPDLSLGIAVAGHVQPMPAPAFPVVRRGQQSIHHLGKRIRAVVFHKILHLLWRWRQTDEIEGRAPNQCPLIGRRVWFEVLLFKFGQYEIVHRCLTPCGVFYLGHFRFF